MKFQVTVCPKGEAQKQVQLRGFPTLEMACAAALGIASIQPENTNVAIWLPARGSYEHASLMEVVVKGFNDSQTKLLAGCVNNLQKVKAERKATDGRRAFVKEVGFDAMDLVRADKATFAAFLKSDFTAVRTFLHAVPKEVAA